MFWLIILTIILALFYDFLNGANDRANAIATVTATKALTPMQALLLASAFNLAGAFATTEVAKTIGKGIVSPDFLTAEPQTGLTVLAAGVFGAIAWTFLCTRFGIPISVTHSLVGGLLGAGISAGGIAVIRWHVLTDKVFLAIFLGPAVGFLAGSLLFAAVSWTLFLFFKGTPSVKAEEFFKKGQIFSASFMAFSHGMNDTQNAMGVITMALFISGFLPAFVVPAWVKLACGFCMGIGTFLFGWRVMHTLGWRLTKLEPKHGFSAETGAGIAVTAASLVGMPVSTTHVIGSSVIGGSFFQSIERVRWSEVGKMVTAWIITIPLSAIFGFVAFLLLSNF